MKNIIGELRYDLEAVRKIERPNDLPYVAGQLNLGQIIQARQLLANVYVLTGTIDPKDLTTEGALSRDVDPYYYNKQCTYYGVWDKNKPERLLMAARLIHPDASGLQSLQVHLNEFDAQYRKALLKRNPAEIAELAAYVKAPELGPVASRLCSLYLIRELIRGSREKGVQTWIFGLRPQLKTKYERLFGPGLDRRGKVVHLGKFKSEFLPYSVDVELAWRRLMESSSFRVGSKAIARFVGMTNPAPTPNKKKLAHQYSK